MDLICFSHLRWDFVLQRPQHLLTRFISSYRVFYIEEPVFDSSNDHLTFTNFSNVWVVKMHLQGDRNEQDILPRQKELLSSLFRKMDIVKYFFWYYSPMALPLGENLNPEIIIYDCMDELANFRFAPTELKELEEALINRSDLVFTGGESLFNKKKHLHSRVYCFPSSIDKKHFNTAQNFIEDPPDQEKIPHPRLGYFGVLDERIDTTLIRQMAIKRKDWHFIFLGPITKISPESLPKEKNIHYLGNKDYKILPEYLSGWDIALMPFAINESTEFISPTKTPEYLAAHKPVISTPIKDVVTPYGKLNLVNIASTADEFISAAEKELKSDRGEWKKNVNTFLSNTSWDITFQNMHQLIKEQFSLKSHNTTFKEFA
ncbi:MAG: glycosyltransferase [Ignavibacteria bacterium]